MAVAEASERTETFNLPLVKRDAMTVEYPDEYASSK